MSNFRKDRVGELLKEVISEIVTLRIKDPRVQGITITDIRMSQDLKTANIYFSGLGDGREDSHRKGLEAASGFIRHQLRKNLDLKYIPELHFFYDTSFDNSLKINKILKELADKGSSHE
jgi:ribosome-binding factor A